MNKVIVVAAIFSFNLSFGQGAEIVKLHDLQKLMFEGSGKIQVINFWATWCGPCVQELPLFEKITAEGRADVQVTLVSLDLDLDPNPSRVYEFISRKKIRSAVWLLDEPDPNSWINQVEKEWSGALPATILINQKTGKRKFIGRPLREGELEQFLKELQS